MSAFHVGQRVRFSKHAYAANLIREGQTYRGKPVATEGEVVRVHTRRREFVDVRRDGRKTAETYHVDFWEPIPAAADQEASHE